MTERRIAAVLGRVRSKSGQSLLESCLVIALICLVFFSLMQVSQLFATKEVLNYAAARGARSKTVGFNRFMVYKTIRVGAIPAAGALINPDTPGGPAEQHLIETARIPDYLGSQNWSQLRPILDYENWDSLNYSDSVRSHGDGMEILTIRTRQEVPLWAPFHRSYYAGDQIEMTGESIIENHYPLYLEDEYL